MLITTTTNEKIEQLPEFIGKAINARIESCADEIIEKLKDKLEKEVDSRRSEIITGVILDVYKTMDIDQLTNGLTITIREKE